MRTSNAGSVTAAVNTETICGSRTNPNRRAVSAVDGIRSQIL